MKKIKMNLCCLFLTLVLFNQSAKSQIILPSNALRNIYGDNDADINTTFGILGSGSLYSQSSVGNSIGAGGGLLLGIPLTDQNLAGKKVIHALSIIGKYNASSIKTFQLRDSLYNINSVANVISRQLFSQDNGNNFNIGARYNIMKKKDDGRLLNLSFLTDVNITDYHLKLDSSANDFGEFQSRNLKLSSGFSAINPMVGFMFDWSASALNQNFGINLSLVGSGVFIYEKDMGKDYIGSWAYSIFNNKSFDKDFYNNLSKKINNFYAFYSRLNIYINDINIFLVIQKNFTNVSVNEAELQGINNRNLFINWGINFSPSLLHFDF